MYNTFDKTRPYFVIDPEGPGVVYFETLEERDKYASECLKEYLDDYWAEEVTDVVAGIVTHSAQQTDLEMRPETLYEDDCDESGIYWDADCQYRCNYKMLPVST